MKVRCLIIYFALVFLGLSFCHHSWSLEIEELQLSSTEIEKLSRSVVVVYNRKAQSQGSGFFVLSDGSLVTSSHVIERASPQDLEIKTYWGEYFRVKEIRADDKTNDLALLRADISSTMVSPLVIAPSLPAKGEEVIVIGNPFGLEFTVSHGYVANLPFLPDWGRLIQLDLGVYAGSSGSPVLNMQGEVVGVVKGGLPEAEKINFAIPAERVLRLAPGIPTPKPKPTVTPSPVPSTPAPSIAPSTPSPSPRSSSHDAWYYVGLGDALQAAGRYPEAVEAYRNAIHLDSENARAHFGLGEAYYLLGQYREAARSFGEVVRLRPKSAHARYNLGLCYLMLQDKDAALKQYETLKGLHPSLAEQLLREIERYFD